MASNNSKWIEMSSEELVSEITAAQATLTTMKFDNGLQGLENPLELRQKRRDIARMKTELRKKELATFSPEQIAKRGEIRRRRRK